jgi:phosphoglycerate dehydrogenase-like enzyme
VRYRSGTITASGYDVRGKTRCFCMSPDEPNFAGWCDELRARAGGLYPSEVRMVPSHAELHVNLAPACALVVESFPVGTQELGCAPQLKVVHKYGAVLRNIGTAACAAAGVKVLSVMKNPDALMTSCSRSTM